MPYELSVDKATYATAAFRFFDKVQTPVWMDPRKKEKPTTVSEFEWLEARPSHVTTLITEAKELYLKAAESTRDTLDSDYNVTTCVGLKADYNNGCNCGTGTFTPLGELQSCKHVKTHYQQENCCANTTSLSVPLKPDLRQAADDAAAVSYTHLTLPTKA